MAWYIYIYIYICYHRDLTQKHALINHAISLLIALNTSPDKSLNGSALNMFIFTSPPFYACDVYLKIIICAGNLDLIFLTPA